MSYRTKRDLIDASRGGRYSSENICTVCGLKANSAHFNEYTNTQVFKHSIRKDGVTKTIYHEVPKA